MDKRNSIVRVAALAYSKPQKVPTRRTKPSGIPGWLFDAFVVFILLLLAAAYLAS